MTELEAIARKLTAELTSIVLQDDKKKAILNNITAAYELGRASARTPAQIEAWQRNRQHGGKPGRKDKQPRTRRTQAEIENDKETTP